MKHLDYMGLIFDFYEARYTCISSSLLPVPCFLPLQVIHQIKPDYYRLEQNDSNTSSWHIFVLAVTCADRYYSQAI